MPYKTKIIKAILLVVIFSFPTTKAEENPSSKKQKESATQTAQAASSQKQALDQNCTNFNKYEFIVNMLTNYDSIQKNDGLLKTGMTFGSVVRELSFVILSAAIGSLFYIPLANPDFKFTEIFKDFSFSNILENIKEKEHPHLVGYFCVPTTAIYLLISYLYQYCQKSKINKRILSEFLKNWQYFKQLTPQELHQTLDSLHQEYLNDDKKLSLSEQEAQNTIADIFKICVCRK